MKRLVNAAALIAVLAATPSLLDAQWGPYQSRGVPRLPDGSPNLNAPAPRTPDGKPDLSGVWRGTGAAARQGGPAEPPSPIPVATFRDVGANFKDGLPLQPWAAELLK